MPRDTPPVFVNNDRQWDSMCEMSKSMPLRLCISVKNGILENHDQDLNREDTATVNREDISTEESVDSVSSKWSSSLFHCLQKTLQSS